MRGAMSISLRRPGWDVIAGCALVLGIPLGAQPAKVTVFELAPSGNEARYRVKEQLVGIDLPNDAVGVTSAISGTIAVDTSGRPDPSQSRISVNITGLKSDSTNRDRVIQGRTLHTDKFPTVDLVPKEFVGLKWPLTAPATFELRGDLTIHGVTKPWSWQVTAGPKDGGFAGRATTTFTFGDFGMTPPTSFRVLSVEDKVTLEYDFAFVPKRS